jgi:hypothetical protein
MDLIQIPAMLSELWDDLPHLVGPQWTELFPQVAAAVAKLADASDADRPRVIFSLAMLFQPYPHVSAAFSAILEESQPRRGSGRDEFSTVNWHGVTRDLLSHIDGPTAIRYTEVFATRRLMVGDQGVAVVTLPVPPAVRQDAARSPSNSGHIDVHFLADVTSAGIRIEGGTVRRITISPGGTTEPATFLLRAVSKGKFPVSIDLLQAGRLLTTIDFTVEVTSTDAAPAEREPGRLSPAVVQLGGIYAPPPDLDLRVIVEARDGQTILRYFLHSPNGAASHHYEPAGEVTLTGSPTEQQNRLVQRIEQLTPTDAGQKLRAFGEGLYREFLSPQLKRAYSQFRSGVRTLQITSDEPWIPWELVRPFDDATHPAVDDDFWAAQFELSRWLAGSTPPVGRIDIDRLACVEAAKPPKFPFLPAAKGERLMLSAFAIRHGVEDVSPKVADRSSVEALIENPSVRLWHFATHGDIDPKFPDEAALVLADGSRWLAEDLHGPWQAAVAQGRPLVMMNACRVGRQAWSFTRLGGWVDAWVRRSRCGAFIGPQWSITDAAAAAFAEAIYNNLEYGRTLAAATRAARAEVRAAFPGDATWLAYSLYAHPNMEARFGPPTRTPQAAGNRPDLPSAVD